MLIIGIDPGISGSICFFEDGKILDVIEMYPYLSNQLSKKKDVNKSDAILIARFYSDTRLLDKK